MYSSAYLCIHRGVFVAFITIFSVYFVLFVLLHRGLALNFEVNLHNDKGFILL